MKKACLIFLLSVNAFAGEWIADGKSGCQVWNSMPQTGETIEWIGGCENGKASGDGVLKWYKDGKPGTVSEGKFIDGKLNGKGRSILADGSIYEGDYKNWEWDGHGKLIFADGGIYEGEFKDSKRDGKGKETFSNGAVYEGDFKDNNWNGHGKLIFADGGIYEGEFKGGKRDGKGKLMFPKGGSYEGEFNDNKRDGKGKYVYPNGDIEEGDFKQNNFVNGKVFKKDGETFTYNATGIWSDPATGLVWAKCMVRRDGSVPIGDECGGEIAELDWPSAMTYALNSRFGGFDDWRIPTNSELSTLGKKIDVEWWGTVWTSNITDNGKIRVACRHFRNTGSCGADAWGYNSNMRVALVRGGKADGTFSRSLNDHAVVEHMARVQAATAEKDRLLNALVPTGGVGDKWGLLNHLPNVLTTTPAIDDGTLNAIDWYVSGLRQAEKARKTIRTDFLGYLNSRRVYDYDNHFTSPFDQEDFTRQLAAEKKSFVDRIFDYSAAALPSKIYSFTPIKLDSYDFATEELKFSTCRDLGIYNNGGANGMICGGSGVVMPDKSLADDVQKLGALGEMATAGKVKLVKFASFFTGDNNGAPLYILGRGMPGELRLKLPKDQVRMLYDLAKQTRVRKEYESELGGKMLSAKVLYDAPQAKGFNASNALHKDWFVTFTGGAAVSFEIRALAVCFFDGEGKAPLFCRALDQPLAAASSKNK